MRYPDGCDRVKVDVLQETISRELKDGKYLRWKLAKGYIDILDTDKGAKYDEFSAFIKNLEE